MALLSRKLGAGETGVDEAVVSGARPLASGMARVNLLPPEILEARKLRVLQFGGAVVVAAAAIVVAGGWYAEHHSLNQAKNRLQAADTKHGQLQEEVTRYGNVTELYRKVDAAEAMVSSATATEVHWSTYLDDLSISLPQHIWLSNLTMGTSSSGSAAPATAAAAKGGTAAPAVGTVTLSGSGYVHNDVANLLERLAGIKGFFNVYLSSSTEALVGSGTTKVPTVNWSSTSSLDSDALAHPNGGGDR